ncbi:hypothetical protein HPP92_010464 [Vanilla planifolia]|uniref:Uncharacterized protein n=1 Tax=Vanilla planifolia TaxID=51239 RepID=A0A835V3H3_VANPL|nr:hypothetical protein HPP92_010464 [Vanilla planifolia]
MSDAEELHRKQIAAYLQSLFVAKYDREDSVPCQIEEGLFLGSVGVARNNDGLKRLNITHVLIVAKSLEPAFPNDFVYKKIEGKISNFSHGEVTIDLKTMVFLKDKEGLYEDD